MSDAAPEPDPPEAPLASFDVQENSKGQPVWRMSLYADALVLDPGRGTLPISIERAELGRIELHDGLILRRVLAAELDPDSDRKTVFVLGPEGFSALDRWIGPPGRKQLKEAIKVRMGLRWTVPVGVLWILFSLPRDASGGVEPSPLQEEKIALGAALIVMGILSRLVTHRGMFLLYSLWFSAFAADCILDVLAGQAAWFLGPLAVAGVFLAIGGLRQFHRFAVMRPES